MQEKIKDDTISRQAAIDIFDDYNISVENGELEAYSRDRKRLCDLPSVQPEPSTEIQEILDYLDTTLHPIVSPDNWYVYSELHDMVSRLPSIQPERMKLVQQAVNTIMSTSRSYSIRDRAFRNAARLVQCAIDGEAPDFEQIPEGDEMLSAPRWIPCSEKLPEEAEARYWVCTDGGYQCQCRWTNDVFGLGEGDTWTWKIFDIPQYSKVIAWMPLPEPYVERRTDDGE